MYSIKSLLTEVGGIDGKSILSEKIYCVETTRDLTLLTNYMNSPLNGFTFTIILEGECQVRYNGDLITLSRQDLFLYLPGLDIEVVYVSDNYKGICLFLDNDIVMKNIFAKDFLRAAYFPAVRYKEPKISLGDKVFIQVNKRFMEIISYLNSGNPLKIEASLLEFSLFLIDLFYLMDFAVNNNHGYSKAEEVVIKFLQLLPENFSKEANIDFYADFLNISKVYLSRVVKKTTGITVMEHIERARITESERLLQNTSLTVKEIAEKVGFSDHPSFTKFFRRYKTISPSLYRSLNPKFVNN